MSLNIKILSDLHFEHHKDDGRGFIKSLSSDGVDVLVLAGDITSQALMKSTLKLFCDKFKYVVFVLGNHEYYGSNRNDVVATAWLAHQDNKNLHWLDNTTCVIEGQRFVGTTLWFRQSISTTLYRDSINDFFEIEGFDSWVYELNHTSLKFLEEEMREGDVAITHHLPSNKSVGLKYERSSINCFFVCDIENIIAEKGPALFIHGHGHSSSEYFIGDTQVVSNPFGYNGENKEFKEHLVITV